MKRCDVRTSDIRIDEVTYRLESLAELRAVQHLGGFKGVSFTDLGTTVNRLVAERKEALRLKRLAQKQA